MEGGTFDLKGLAEWGVKQALGKVPALEEMKDDITPLVGAAMTAFGLPSLIEIGVAGTILTKAVLHGIDRTRKIAESHRAAAKAKEEHSL